MSDINSSFDIASDDDEKKKALDKLLGEISNYQSPQPQPDPAADAKDYVATLPGAHPVPSEPAYDGPKAELAPPSENSYEFQQAKDNYAKTLNVGLGDRPGITPDFTPEQIAKEADARARNEVGYVVPEIPLPLKSGGAAQNDVGAPAAPDYQVPVIPTPLLQKPSSGMAESLPERAGFELPLKTDTPKPSLAHAGAFSGKPLAPAIPDKDYVQDALKKLDTIDPEMQKAIEMRDKLQFISNLARAGRQLAAGLSHQDVNKIDYSNEDSLAKQSLQGVEDISAKRKARMDKIQESLKLEELGDKMAMNDGASNVSRTYREMAKAAGFSVANDASASTVSKLLPMIDMKIRMDALKEERAQRLKDKTDLDAAKAKAELTTKIGTIMNRGTVSKAADVDRRVDNINGLLNMYTSLDKPKAQMIKDLDKMPANQVHALTDEMAQVFTGGMSTEGKAGNLMHPTLMSGIKKFWAETAGAPTGAQLGSFIYEYKPYLEDLQKNSRRYVKETISPIITGYNKRVSKDDLDEVKKEHYRYFGDDEQKKTSAKPGDIIVAHGKRYKVGPDGNTLIPQ
jgi:hypothetical protein